jgi:hypothetical protein
MNTEKIDCSFIMIIKEDYSPLLMAELLKNISSCPNTQIIKNIDALTGIPQYVSENEIYFKICFQSTEIQIRVLTLLRCTQIMFYCFEYGGIPAHKPTWQDYTNLALTAIDGYQIQLFKAAYIEKSSITVLIDEYPLFTFPLELYQKFLKKIEQNFISKDHKSLLIEVEYNQLKMGSFGIDIDLYLFVRDTGYRILSKTMEEMAIENSDYKDLLIQSASVLWKEAEKFYN